MLKFKTSCAVLAYLSYNLLNEVGLSLFRYFEVGLRVCDIVVKKFTFAISSADEFLSTFCIAFHIFVTSGIETSNLIVIRYRSKSTRWRTSLKEAWSREDQFLNFWAPVTSFGTGETRHFKFHVRIDTIACITDYLLKGMCTGSRRSRNPFEFWEIPDNTSETDTVQDRDIVNTGYRPLIRSNIIMTYRIAAIP